MASPSADETNGEDAAAPAAPTAAQIRQQTDPGSFERGSDYFRKGAILDPIRRGNLLRAESRGSSGGPYRVEATLAHGGQQRNPVDYACDCPRGGFCKHVVALLLTWAKTPERFSVRQPVAELLAGKNRDELVALVDLLLRRRPELEELLDIPLPVAMPAAERGSGQGTLRSIEPRTIRRQVVAAFRSDDGGYDRDDRYGWYDDEGEDHSAIAGELRPLVEVGDRYADAGQWANALTVYTAIVEEVLVHEEEFYDDDPLVEVVAACGVGLVRCLDAQPGLDAADRLDADARAELVETLFEVWDAGGSVDDAFAEEPFAVGFASSVGDGQEYGVAEEAASYDDEDEGEADEDEDEGGTSEAAGDGYADADEMVGADIPAALARHVTAAERAGLEERLRQAIVQTAAEAYKEYQTREAIRFLVALNPEAGDEEMLTAFRDAGLWADAAAMLLRLERVEEAIALASRHLTKPGVLLGFADRLLAMGGERVGQGLALVDGRLWESEGVKHEHDMAYLEWLGKRYAAHDRPKEALEAERRRFKRRPDHVTYEAVRAAAALPGQPAGLWDKQRPELLAELRKQAAWGPLIEVHLREGEVGDALAALAKLERGEKRTAGGGYGYWAWGHGLGEYRSRVAKEAEREFPDEAIRLYRLLADAAIEQRARPHYQRAAGYLRRVMAILTAGGREAEWQTSIAALRKQHPRLRALKEELDALGLH